MVSSVSAIESLGLGKSLTRRLKAAEVTTLSELAELNRREIQAIHGIGEKTVDKIEQAADKVGIELADDPLAPYQCVREGRAAWDVGLRSFFLCKKCVTEWTERAFSSESPAYNKVLLSGTCQNCNRRCEHLRLAQWFLCGNCERVARSIGRSVTAEKYVANRFEELFRGTSLRIVELDPPVLRARDAQAPETKTATIDFAVYDGEQEIAGIELKTGRSHLGGWAPVGSKMNRFQLDHGDCDDIAAVAEARSILVYLFHAQVIDRAEPPTTRFVATGLWWIDPYSFRESWERSGTRPREIKIAAYYRTDLFSPFSDFREHWESDAMERLRDRFDLEGQPQLYGNGPS